MELLLMSWRSISTAVVLSTELPFCVTGSRAIQRGRFSLCMWIYSIWCHLNLQYNYNYADISSLNCLFLAPFHSFAYIEFSDRDSVTSAIGLHETLFRGRVLKVRSVKTMWWCWRKTQTVSPTGCARTGYCILNCIKCTVYICKRSAEILSSFNL